MSYFHEAYEIVRHIEGGYSNNPADDGGETYKGISRVHHPHWAGWGIVDFAKQDDAFPKNLAQNEMLTKMVKDFYREEFWRVCKCEGMPWQMALCVFDGSVNHGTYLATVFLQRALQIKADGKIGPITEKAIYDAGNSPQSSHDFTVRFMGYRAQLYATHRDYEEFGKGWMRRLVHICLLSNR